VEKNMGAESSVVEKQSSNTKSGHSGLTKEVTVVMDTRGGKSRIVPPPGTMEDADELSVVDRKAVRPGKTARKHAARDRKLPTLEFSSDSEREENEEVDMIMGSWHASRSRFQSLQHLSRLSNKSKPRHKKKSQPPQSRRGPKNSASSERENRKETSVVHVRSEVVETSTILRSSRRQGSSGHDKSAMWFVPEDISIKSIRKAGTSHKQSPRRLRSQAVTSGESETEDEVETVSPGGHSAAEGWGEEPDGRETLISVSSADEGGRRRSTVCKAPGSINESSADEGTRRGKQPKNKKNVSFSEAREEVRKPRSHGRPGGVQHPEPAASGSDSDPMPVLKRRRGRPRKKVKEFTGGDGNDYGGFSGGASGEVESPTGGKVGSPAGGEVEPVPKRRRGRPRKTVELTGGDGNDYGGLSGGASGEVESPTGGKVGSPAGGEVEPVPKRRRGRPRKTVELTGGDGNDYGGLSGGASGEVESPAGGKVGSPAGGEIDSLTGSKGESATGGEVESPGGGAESDRDAYSYSSMDEYANIETVRTPGGRKFRRLEVARPTNPTPGMRRSKRARVPPIEPGQQIQYNRRESGM
jgi:hypothetical protein